MEIPRAFTANFTGKMNIASARILTAAAPQFTASEQRFINVHAPKLRRFAIAQRIWTQEAKDEYKAMEDEANKALELAGVSKERRQVLNYCGVHLHPNIFEGLVNISHDEVATHIKAHAMDGTFDALYKLSLAYPVPAKVKEFFAEVKELSDSIKEEELAAA